MKARILIVDDEENIRTIIKSRLEQDGYNTATAVHAEDALNKYNQRGEIAVLVTSLRLPGKDGFELMKELSQRNPNLKAIFINGQGKKEDAIKVLRAGASDYCEKPLNLNELSASVDRCLKLHRAEQIKQDSTSQFEARLQKVEGKFEDSVWYVSKSHSMEGVNERLTSLRREAMRGDVKEPFILLVGESGAGQEGIARMIHAGSRRGKGPWSIVNCSQISAAQLETEIWGQERSGPGGGTTVTYGLFELARGGTLVLEEVAALSRPLQEKLLNALQKKVYSRVGGASELELDIRIISTAHSDFRSKIQDGKFHEGLYKLLSGVTVDVPSLSDRKEDIVPMAVQFAETSFRSLGKPFGGFTSDAEKALREYSWPGNVRELYFVIERVALVWDGGGHVSAQALALSFGPNPNSGGSGGGTPKLQLVPAPGSPQTSFDPNLSYTELKKHWSDSFEKEYLVATLNRHGGNVSAAARESKLDRSNFLRLLRRHGLRAEEYRKVAA